MLEEWLGRKTYGGEIQIGQRNKGWKILGVGYVRGEWKH